MKLTESDINDYLKRLPEGDHKRTEALLVKLGKQKKIIDDIGSPLAEHVLKFIDLQRTKHAGLLFDSKNGDESNRLAFDCYSTIFDEISNVIRNYNHEVQRIKGGKDGR